MKADDRPGLRNLSILSLSEMKRGESGLIREIRGGFGLVKRLDSMNIRVGKPVTKVSSILRRGPVTVQVDRAHLALGFGMANRIFVEVKR